MSKYKYSLDNDYWSQERDEGLLESPKAFISIKMQNKNYYGKPIRDFFKIPRVQIAVDEGKLDDKIIPKGDYTEWSPDILAAFLTLSEIEFMSGLDDTWVKNNLDTRSLKEN